jgi:hypothetical protein
MVPHASAAALFDGSGVYTENFDSIGPTGTIPPANWITGNYASNNSRVDPPDSAMNSNPLVVDDGSSGTKLISYNYGTTGASDRAIGQIPSTSNYGDAGLQVEMLNNTGAPITALHIAYAGEQWRDYQGSSSSGPERIRVYISQTNGAPYVSLGPSLDFTAPQNGGLNAALDGNAPANRALISATVDLVAIGFGAIAPNDTFHITWHDWNDNSTNDHGLAVDDVSIRVVPEPASLALLALGLLGLAGRVRSVRRD